MKNLSLRSLRCTHLIVIVLAVTWAFTSYMYNWLNVGGGEGAVNFWIIAGEIATYSFFASWLILLLITGFNATTLFPTIRGRAISWALATCVPIIVVFIADWFFHRGFPPPPPM